MISGKNSGLLLLVVVIGLTGCGPRVFTEGKYQEPETYELLTDKFMDEDLRQIANSLVRSMVANSPVSTSGKKLVLQVEQVANRTHEHIDVKSLTDKVKVALSKSGKVAFTEREMRGTIAEEYEYHGGEYVKKETAKRKGRQVGADYLLHGDITSIVQQAGGKEIIYYKVTLNLTNLETNLIEWTDEKEVKKAFKKKHVSP